MHAPMETIQKILRENDEFLVAAHVNPDGDALGSTAAMGFLLQHLGKRFTLYNVSPVPAQFGWLTLPAPLANRLPDKIGWVITLDCGNKERVGPELAARINPDKAITIDHHLGDETWAKLNWVDTSQPATGMMVARLAQSLGMPLTGPLAEAVYTALVTDTGFFTYGNTTPESLELAAELLRGGMDAATVNHRITSQWTLPRLRLLTEIITGAEVHHGGQVAITAVTEEIFQRTGTTAEDTEDLINFVRDMRGMRVAALLREDAPDTYKISLRSHGADNIQPVAASFGGGGHMNAAGATLTGMDLAQAKAELLARITSRLELA